MKLHKSKLFKTNFQRLSNKLWYVGLIPNGTVLFWDTCFQFDEWELLEQILQSITYETNSI